MYILERDIMSVFHTCVKNVNDWDIWIDQEMCTLYLPGTSPSILIFESFRGGCPSKSDLGSAFAISKKMSLHTRKKVKTLTSAFVSDPLVLRAFRIFPLTRPFRIFPLTRPWNLGHSKLGRQGSVWKSSNWNISRYKTSDFINKITKPENHAPLHVFGGRFLQGTKSRRARMEPWLFCHVCIAESTLSHIFKWKRVEYFCDLFYGNSELLSPWSPRGSYYKYPSLESEYTDSWPFLPSPWCF